MGLLTLEEHLKAWQKNPISPLNDWYYLAPDWVLLLISAVNFLAGDYPGNFLKYFYFLTL